MKNASNQRSAGWNIAKEGTFADYFSMRPGDHIYFFVKRMIYGIGELVDIDGDCKYLSYQDADNPRILDDAEYEERHPLLEDGCIENRCFCIFRPAPFFFGQGVDMDEVLNSNQSMFKMLRVMWKVSFIKVGDDEDKAIRDILLKRNEDRLRTGEGALGFDGRVQSRLAEANLASYRFCHRNIVAQVADGRQLKHEMALEAALCDILTHRSDTVFGHWDYISHQVAASPFKPVDYMDKIDIFGYRYIDGYDTKSKYLVLELKRGEATVEAIGQIMKYVDWVRNEYAHGDYSMVEAYVVAFGFPQEVVEAKEEYCIRNYMKGFRPVVPSTWTDVKLIEYSYIDGGVDFTEKTLLDEEGNV